MRRAALLALGVYIGFIGAIVHRHSWHTDAVDWPWGLVLVILATYAVVLGAERILRTGGAWFGLGWGLVLMAQQFLPGRTYLVAGDWLGWSFTIGCAGAIVLGVLRPPRLVQ